MTDNNRTEYKVSCRGCHGGCMYLLTVKDGRLVDARPDPNGPLNKGHGCAKGRTIMEQMYHPDRITHPMKRIGPKGSGKWERITWDEAYDMIAEKLGALIKESGPECVGTLTGTGRHAPRYLTRFARVLGTPNTCSAGALVCLGPRRKGSCHTAGIFCGVDYYGEKKPGGILVWGSNPAVSGPDGELQWHIQDAVKARTPLLVIDPYPTELAKHAQLWLRIRPGTDGALALGILNLLISEDLYDHDFVDNWTYGFEQLKGRCRQYPVERVAEITTIPAEDIIKAAHWIAGTKPLGLEWGNAFEQSTNAFQTCRAIFMIPAITGNYDVPGGFVESKEIAPSMVALPKDLDRADGKLPLRMSPISRYDAPNGHPWALLEAMRTGKPYPIRALFSHANNALLSLPDTHHTYECLQHLDFFVCMDFFMNPTAEMADLFLPAGLWPEVDCVYCMPEFGEQAVLCQQKALRVDECKSDEEFFFELCRRMGLDYGAETQEELLDAILEEMAHRRPEYEGVNFKKFKELGYLTPSRTYYNYKARGGFNTPSGKFELYSITAEADGVSPLPYWEELPESPVSRPDLLAEYPLVFTSGKRQQQYFISNNRQIISLRKVAQFPLVSMHPDTAAKYGLREGDWAWVESPRGKITQKVELVPEMDPNVVHCQFGWWYPEDPSPLHGCFESNANVLTWLAPPYDDFGAYQMRGLLCRISPNPEGKAIEERYYNSKYYRPLPVDDSSDAIVLDPNRCLLCGACVEACENIQSVGALEIVTRDGQTFVTAKGAGCMAHSGSCVGCGRCAASCPTGAIRMKSSLEQFRAALQDPDTHVVAQVAPSVRVGISQALGFPADSNAIPEVTRALYNLGVDSVVDTTYSADLTAMEEGRELFSRISNGGPIPIFTSCCPAWVKFCEQNYPDLARHLSSTRSPQQIYAAVLRDACEKQAAGMGKRRVKLVSIMPCTAKKAELLRRESQTHGKQDLDLALTTTELLTLIREAGMTGESLSACEPAFPESQGSGGGALFGVSGGVTEAVVRAYFSDFGEDQMQGIVRRVQSGKGICEFELPCMDCTLKVAVVSGLGNARKLMERIRGGEHFDLVEVMACPGGCVMGGGQPHDVYSFRQELEDRTNGILFADEGSAFRRPSENTPACQALAGDLRGREYELLHRNFDWVLEGSSKP